MVSGVCLNSLATTSRTVPASSSSGLAEIDLRKSHRHRLKIAVVPVEADFRLTPVVRLRSAATAFEYDIPFEIRSTAPQPARLLARTGMAFHRTLGVTLRRRPDAKRVLFLPNNLHNGAWQKQK